MVVLNVFPSVREPMCAGPLYLKDILLDINGTSVVDMSLLEVTTKLKQTFGKATFLVVNSNTPFASLYVYYYRLMQRSSTGDVQQLVFDIQQVEVGLLENEIILTIFFFFWRGEVTAVCLTNKFSFPLLFIQSKLAEPAQPAEENITGTEPSSAAAVMTDTKAEITNSNASKIANALVCNDGSHQETPHKQNQDQDQPQPPTANQNQNPAASTLQIRRGMFSMLWDVKLEAESTASLASKLAFVLSFSFSWETFSLRHRVFSTLFGWERIPAIKFMLMNFLLACFDIFTILLGLFVFLMATTFDSSVAQEAIPLAVLSGVNLVGRILLTLHFMQRYPIVVMLFSTMPVTALWTSISTSFIYFQDLSASLTKEYDGFRFNMCRSLSYLFNIPFAAIWVGITWSSLLQSSSADDDNNNSIQNGVDQMNTFGHISSIACLLVNFILVVKFWLTSVAYYDLGCETYWDYESSIGGVFGRDGPNRQ